MRYKNYKIGLINVRNWVFLSLIITISHTERTLKSHQLLRSFAIPPEITDLETMQVIAILLLLLIWPFISIFFASPLFYRPFRSDCKSIAQWVYNKHLCLAICSLLRNMEWKKATYLIEISNATKANDRVEKNTQSINNKWKSVLNFKLDICGKWWMRLMQYILCRLNGCTIKFNIIVCSAIRGCPLAGYIDHYCYCLRVRVCFAKSY